MLNLIKTDFKKILSDKLFIIAAIISCGISFLIPLLLLGVKKIAENTSTPVSPDVMTTAMSNSFSIVSTVGIIVVILVTIIIGKEFTNGNVRNKVVIGYKRHQIYISLLIVFYTILIGLMLISTIIMTLFGLCFFKYSNDPYSSKELVKIFFLSLLLGLLIQTVVAALCMFFAIGLNNLPLAILVPLLLGLVLNLLSSFLPDTNEILTWLHYLNICDSLTYLNNYSYTLKEYFARLIPVVIFTPLLLFLRIKIFNKKDLK